MGNRYNPQIQKYTKRNKLDWHLVKGMIRQESAFLPQVVSRVGARGLMQIMPKTWVWVVQDLLKKDYKWNDAFDPEKNIEVGCRYLAWLYSYIGRRKNLVRSLLHKRVLCAYNWGIGNLQRNGWSLKNIPKETREYISLVTKHWEEYQGGDDTIRVSRKRLGIVETLVNGASKEIKEWKEKEAK